MLKTGLGFREPICVRPLLRAGGGFRFHLLSVVKFTSELFLYISPAIGIRSL